MSALEQAARMALEALSHHRDQGRPCIEQSAYDALSAALDAGQDQPVAWVRAIDEAMVTHHIGTAEPSDDYETAKRKLNSLLYHAQSIGEYFAKQAAHDASPPARQPLTDEQIAAAVFPLYQGPSREDVAEMCFDHDLKVSRAIERAHGIT